MNRRQGKRANKEVLKYFLDKYREQFHQIENDRRKTLRNLYNK